MNGSPIVAQNQALRATVQKAGAKSKIVSASAPEIVTLPLTNGRVSATVELLNCKFNVYDAWF